MTPTHPFQWMNEQAQLGRSLCVVLDSDSARETRQALLKTSRFDQYVAVYRETHVAELTDAGPFIFTFDEPNDKRIAPLLKHPERHWGWLASLAKGDLPTWVAHWHERLFIGTRPDQALYRFHDNRVLTRALAHLPVEAYPAYLGPALSVCYWQGSHWENADNPTPGTHPVPALPPWLQTPVPPQQALALRMANAHRYLLAEHPEAYAELAVHHEPETWLHRRLALADSWGWLTSEQLAFLLTQSLRAPDPTQEKYWQAHAQESPTEHFERVRQTADFWQGKTPL